jgi:hypothetical protein
MKRIFLLFVLLASFARTAFAHAARPVYLEINETAPGRYDVMRQFNSRR